MNTEKNLGALDRVLRGIATAIMIYCAVFIVRDTLALSLLGIIILVNSYAVIMANCPMYSLIHFSTCGKTQELT